MLFLTSVLIELLGASILMILIVVHITVATKDSCAQWDNVYQSLMVHVPSIQIVLLALVHKVLRSILGYCHNHHSGNYPTRYNSIQDLIPSVLMATYATC